MTEQTESDIQPKEPYTQPLLTKLDPLHNLTGKSGEKDPGEDKDPAEKDKDVETN